MSNVNGVGNNNVYDQINQLNKNQSTKTDGMSEDREMFMKLLIAQLQNQDPTSPADTSDFMQQMSTLSNVESIQNLASTMESMSSTLISSQAALQASSMVGQRAFVNTNIAQLPQTGGTVDGLVSTKASSSDIRISIYDGAGNRVDRVSMGAMPPGDHNFVWQANENLPAGNYRIVAEAASGVDGTYEEVATYMGFNINSVTLGQNGIGMKVNTNIGSIDMSEVKQLG
ncbi:flagellar hook capping FlgD N-terminal domain-containing protein [Marinobacterium sediminicola]|uniref:Basal-body rod modification protein FlgD n=1 Tax=Marinobacterium sediminicola TaxID=518898 RepID=A0ABY1RYJ2_9GAMM|nr:flagellar hook capping FlgD N-terminal domain-containing protein [Marinobacterium sediminicola]ULG68800.1 flagellar biosynthesis protein FlgD [Marinobacterium sediminicola]SMR73330.1 flagellar basal-body rod modification protein FlgD [Marinobacterium sediminicola]